MTIWARSVSHFTILIQTNSESSTNSVIDSDTLLISLKLICHSFWYISHKMGNYNILGIFRHQWFANSRNQRWLHSGHWSITSAANFAYCFLQSHPLIIVSCSSIQQLHKIDSITFLPQKRSLHIFFLNKKPLCYIAQCIEIECTSWLLLFFLFWFIHNFLPPCRGVRPLGCCKIILV